MAADYAQMSRQLSEFYDFTGKVVLYVGAGSRQLLDPCTKTRKLIAIDKNARLLNELQRSVAASEPQHPVEVICADFNDVNASSDVIYFEFCLHEMPDPEKALAHAKSLACDVVVYDHSADSEWSYYCAEEDKVRRSSEIVHSFSPRRRQTFHGEQRFANHAELLAKVSPEGPVAVSRILPFASATGIVIPMDYELSLL